MMAAWSLFWCEFWGVYGWCFTSMSSGLWHRIVLW